jgi:hypothetical protein
MLARQAQGHSLEDEQSMIAANALARAEKTSRQTLNLTVETVTKKIRLILNGRDALQKSAGHSNRFCLHLRWRGNNPFNLLVLRSTARCRVSRSVLAVSLRQTAAARYPFQVD